MKMISLSLLAVCGLVLFSGKSTAEEAVGFDMIQAQTKLAYADFLVAQPLHAPHFFGFKSWLSGDDTRVKIYVLHNGMNMEFSYTCHVHEEGPECHRQ